MDGPACQQGEVTQLKPQLEDIQHEAALEQHQLKLKTWIHGPRFLQGDPVKSEGIGSR